MSVKPSSRGLVNLSVSVGETPSEPTLQSCGGFEGLQLPFFFFFCFLLVLHERGLGPEEEKKIILEGCIIEEM